MITRDFLELVHRLPETLDERNGAAPYVIADQGEIDFYPPLPFPRCNAGAFEDWEEYASWFVAIDDSDDEAVSDRPALCSIDLSEFLKVLADVVEREPSTGFVITAWGPSMICVSAFRKKEEYADYQEQEAHYSDSFCRCKEAETLRLHRE